ncbi:ATP synthase F1 subunit delta, partial [bacterium]|nr:ATP synthase F1 subunit delta [bacterium]
MTNTKNTLIAKRYSDALISLVRDDEYEKITSQLKAIAESLNESEELSQFMSNPVISIEIKKDVISNLLAGKVDDVVLNFIKLLVEKERFSAFVDIVEAFDLEVSKIRNIKKVYVTSAIELRDEIKNRLKEKLAYKLNKNIELVEEVNADIIAGLVIKVDDDVIDFANREMSNVVLSLDGRKEIHDRDRVDYNGNGSWE